MDAELAFFLKVITIVLITGGMIIYRMIITEDDEEYTWNFGYENLVWWAICCMVLWGVVGG